MEPTEVYERRGHLEILDVRDSHEWEAGRIDGARHLPMREVPAHLSELPGDRTIVAVCRSGNRSGKVAEYLRANGLSAKAGLPVLTNDARLGRAVLTL